MCSSGKIPHRHNHSVQTLNDQSPEYLKGLYLTLQHGLWTSENKLALPKPCIDFFETQFMLQWVTFMEEPSILCQSGLSEPLDLPLI